MRYAVILYLYEWRDVILHQYLQKQLLVSMTIMDCAAKVISRDSSIPSLQIGVNAEGNLCCETLKAFLYCEIKTSVQKFSLKLMFLLLFFFFLKNYYECCRNLSDQPDHQLVIKIF